MANIRCILNRHIADFGTVRAFGRDYAAKCSRCGKSLSENGDGRWRTGRAFALREVV